MPVWYGIFGKFIYAFGLLNLCLILLILLGGDISNIGAIGILVIIEFFLLKIGHDFTEIQKTLNNFVIIKDPKTNKLNSNDLKSLYQKLIEYKRNEHMSILFIFLLAFLSFILLYVSMSSMASILDSKNIFTVKLITIIIVTLSLIIILPQWYKLHIIFKDLNNGLAIEVIDKVVWLPSSFFSGGWLISGAGVFQINAKDMEFIKIDLSLLLSGQLNVSLKYSPISKTLLELNKMDT